MVLAWVNDDFTPGKHKSFARWSVSHQLIQCIITEKQIKFTYYDETKKMAHD